MAKHRGAWDRGDSFDDQYNRSQQRAASKKQAGRGPYSADKWLAGAGEIRPADRRGGGGGNNNEGCGKATVAFLAILSGIAFLLGPAAGEAHSADTFPSQDACQVTNNNTPSGDCGPFKQLWRESFNSEQVAVGKFSNCAGDFDHRCEGLAGTRYYDTVGAYPNGWPDTAASGADGNQGPVPGYYRPQSTISVIKQSNDDGQLRVKMTSNGTVNKVAAVVPRKCMNLRYGKFTERFVVRQLTPGFKMAHLRYRDGGEVDYPEAGQTFAGDPVSVFTHGFAEDSKDVAANASWLSWHTYSTEIVPGQLRFYLDGKLVKTVTGDYPEPADWVLQNESALGDVAGAAPGSGVTIDTTWLTCYKDQP
jgi:hypothetical protein